MGKMKILEEKSKEYGINVTSKLDKLSLGVVYTLIENSGDIVARIELYCFMDLWWNL